MSYDNLEIIVSDQKFHTFRQALSHVMHRVKLAFSNK
nr:MAG TPA: hypothetical protein [Caudoviricetes sp.]